MCFGPFRRLCHWGPLTALGIIKFVTGMTMHCNSLLWPTYTTEGFLNTLLFLTLSGLTLYNFLSSMYHGPGYLPYGWKPSKDEDCQFLQTCGVCHGYKAPRSHHCRKCGRCVMKMDHHCPWINNCVGWGNHAHFVLFLLFATLGCLQATIILGSSLYKSIHRLHYLHHGQLFRFGLYGMVMCVLALGFAIGVVIAVGMLLFFQLRSIVRNRTSIEDWILDKANYRRKKSNQQFKFPYDLGPWKNIFQVFNVTCQPVGDGITWSVAKGCDQYTLTKEQLEQKNEKKLKSRVYSIIRPASGYWFPVVHGFRVCLSYPFTDEPRIKLDVGDKVVVTRWRRHWLFGEKVRSDLPSGSESLLRTRGWFPRRCAVELIENKDDDRTKSSQSRRISEKKRK